MYLRRSRAVFAPLKEVRSRRREGREEMGSYYTLHHHPTRVEPLRAKKVFSVRENVYIFMKEQVYSARAQDGPRDMERN